MNHMHTYILEKNPLFLLISLINIELLRSQSLCHKVGDVNCDGGGGSNLFYSFTFGSFENRRGGGQFL